MSNAICRENLIVYYYTIKQLTVKQIAKILKISRDKTRKVLEGRSIKVVKDMDLHNRARLAYWLHHRKKKSISYSCEMAKIHLTTFNKFCEENGHRIRHASYEKMSRTSQKSFDKFWSDYKTYKQKNNFIIPNKYEKIICPRMGDEIIRVFNEEGKLKEIKKKVPISQATIKDFLKTNNLHIPPHAEKMIGNYNRNGFRKYSMNDSYFDEIDTEEKAYWLGFILGDGSIIRRKEISYGVSIALSGTDKSHLEKFVTALSSDAIVSDYVVKAKGKEYPISSITFRSFKLVEALERYGIVPNKTLIAKMPKNIPEPFIRDFIRGLFDADGSIPLYKGKPRGFDICGTPELMESIAEILEIDRKYIYRREDLKNFANIRVNKREIYVRLLHYMYKDSTIFLERKYQRYLTAIS